MLPLAALGRILVARRFASPTNLWASCLSYLACLKSVSARPTDPDTMTITALEASASSSGKNTSKLENRWQINEKR